MFLGVCCISLSLGALAAMPSEQQIEIFKHLPPDQQKAIAERYGFSIPSSSEQIGLNEPTLVKPRGDFKPDVMAAEGSPELVSDDLEVEPANNPINGKTTDANGGFSENVNNSAELDLQLLDSKKNKKLQTFGHELFAGNPTTFAPATDIPVPSNYVIGPGDTIIIQLYGKENAEYEVTVSRRGTVQIPELGLLHVVGQTFKELRSYINETVGQKTIGLKANVTMGSLRSIRVFILGEAFRPGSYTVSSLSTMTNALFVSGGINKVGSLRNIQLKRRGRIVGKLDLYDLLIRGDTSKDRRLQPGDVIFIPPVGKTVAVDGEVKRPAIYELRKEHTLASVLNMVGGLTARAFPQATQLERINGEGTRTLISLDITKPKYQKFRLKDGDSINVGSVLDSVEGAVTLKGHVMRPGIRAWRPKMRISDLISGYGDLMPQPDVDYGIIIRESRDDRRISIEQFSLSAVFSNRSAADNKRLYPRDQVIVFGETSSRELILAPLIKSLEKQATANNPFKTVFVSGLVKFPGEYPLVADMTAMDLIKAAGGFEMSAYTLMAELTRYEINSEQQQDIRRLDVNFKNNKPFLLSERDQLFIKKIPNWAEKETVKIEGEVRFPGKYPIYKGDTILELIERAGGITDLGEVSAAIFLREDLKNREQQQILKYKAQIEKDLAEMKLDAAQDISGKRNGDAVGGVMLDQLATAQATGRLVIDLPNIISGRASEKVVLKNLDRLIIPRKSNEVTVVGEVQFPTSHIYESNMDVFDYVDISGGFNSSADDDRIYVIKPNGKIVSVKNGWFRNRNAEVSPGDTIVVPYDTDASSPMVYWTSVSQILFQLATTAAALNTVGVF